MRQYFQKEHRRTRSKTVVQLWLLVVSSLFCANITNAEVYDLGEGDLRLLRLNIPDSVEVVRGILIYGNGAGGDARGRATNDELVAVAESMSFAVLATGRWGRFAQGDNSEIEEFEARIEEFAEISGHPELVNAPWLPMGHSNGGQMSYGMNAKRPHKVIGFIVSKGCCYNILQPSPEALKTPGMLIAGEFDNRNDRRENIRRLFMENRARGALWAWVEEEGTGHREVNGQQLKLDFLLECYRLRYPMDQSPLDGPIELRQLNEYDGWLVDHTTWESGMTQIQRVTEAPIGDLRAYGWVPTRRIAYLYRAFSSHKLKDFDPKGKVGVQSGVQDETVNLNYSVDLTDLNWEKITFYEGDVEKREVFSIGTNNRPGFNYDTNENRLHVHHAVVTLTDGSEVATPLRRVFVDGDAPLTSYQKWANDNLPEGERSATMRSRDGLFNNFERYVFDVGVGDENIQNLPSLYQEIVGEDTYLVYRYTINSEAIDSGVVLTPEFSFNLIDWYPASSPDLINAFYSWRAENTVETFIGAELPKVFYRVSYPGGYHYPTTQPFEG